MITALIGAAVVVAACWAVGTRVVAWSGAKGVPGALAFIVGAACVHLAVFAVLACGIGYRAVWWVGLGGLIVFGIVKRFHAETQRSAEGIGLLAICVPSAVVYFVNALAPETSADGAGYHLGIVAEYLRAHGFVRIPTNFYSDLSQGVEMLYVPAFAIGKHSAAALVHFAFTVALTLAIWSYGRRIGNAWAGAAAAAIVFVSPVVGRDGTTAYIDVASAAIAFSAFYWLEIWDEQRSWRILAVAGLMAGYAFAAKYTMFVVALYAVMFVAWRERRLRSVVIVVAAAAVMILPWMAKNWVMVRDPLAPFATEIFPTPYIHTLSIEDWSAWLRHYDMPKPWRLPGEVTLRGRYTQGILGPIFLLAPLALFTSRRRLLAIGWLMIAVYFGNIGTRFLIPAMPFFALAMMLAIGRWKIALILLVVVQAVASWPWVIPRYANQYVWRITEFPYRAALRIGPMEEYYRAHLAGYDLVRMIEEKVPASDAIFGLTGVPDSYTSSRVIDSFAGARNTTLFDILNVARMEDWQARRRLVFRFGEVKAAKMRIELKSRGSGMEQWSVHELRFYRQGREIERSPVWRVKAWPNPWEIQMTFDNSEVTRWRTWQTGAPGMYIEVNFGRAEAVDEVRMWTSKDFQWDMRFRIEADGRGVSDRFEESEERARFLGRAATSEMYARGIRYLLVPDDDRSADSMGEDPEVWGLTLAGRAAKTSLYRIIP
jgi:hypothetical protein